MDENEFGPVQLYVAAVSVFVVNVSVCPAQSGLFDDGVGVDGGGLTTTLVVAKVLVHPATVTLTEYVPASVSVEFAMLGFCDDEVNPFGPAQEYVAPAIFPANKFIVAFKQTGPLLDAVGGEGTGLIVTVTVCGVPAQVAAVEVGVTV